MFSYLVDRKYILFRTVRELTLDLHLVRKQLIDGTLRGDELASLRSRCVRALVKGNVVQGLDVIVRHPVSGALVTVPGSEVSTSTSSGPSFDSSVSAVRLFAMSVVSISVFASRQVSGHVLILPPYSSGRSVLY